MTSFGELVRDSYAAFHRGDVDQAMTIFAPEVEWTHPDGLSDLGVGGTKRGHQQVRAHMARARTLFSELRPEPREFVESGDRVAVFGVHHMRGAATGLAGEVPFVHSWRFAGGKATHFTDTHDTALVRRLLEPPPDAPDRIIQLGMGFMAARALFSAVELGLFTELAREPMDAEQVRARFGLHERGIRDFLDALVALGLLEREDGRYRDAPATAIFLDHTKPDAYLGDFLSFAAARWYFSWARLTDTLRAGRSLAYSVPDGASAFDLIYADRELTGAFQRAMAGGSLGAATALGERFPWSQVRTVADVGCSNGPLLARLLGRHPHLSGIGFDLPAVEKDFHTTMAEAGLGGRAAFVAGDFRTHPLPAADVLILGHVLLDWEPPVKRMLLRKAYDALPPGGTLLIYDLLIDDERRRHAFGLLISLHMMVDLPGGGEYTGAQARRWLAEAGFAEARVEPLAGPEALIVARKR
jgi:ketosteroid isomerase-like protein/SAM-dependent methyltransferase